MWDAVSIYGLIICHFWIDAIFHVAKHVHVDNIVRVEDRTHNWSDFVIKFVFFPQIAKLWGSYFK